MSQDLPPITAAIFGNTHSGCGFHDSPSDMNNHFTIKTEPGPGNVIGHLYPDGGIKSVGGCGNVSRGLDRYGNDLGSSPMTWLMK